MDEGEATHFYHISEMLNIIQMVKLNTLEGSLSPAKMILHYSDNARCATYERPRWLLMRKSACVYTVSGSCGLTNRVSEANLSSCFSSQSVCHLLLEQS